MLDEVIDWIRRAVRDGTISLRGVIEPLEYRPGTVVDADPHGDEPDERTADFGGWGWVGVEDYARPPLPRPVSGAYVYNGKTVSVVLPTYNEKDSIRKVIEDFRATGVVDDVVVVNNNAAPGTSEEVAGTVAREVHEPIQGYGAAIRRGLREATGDLICICEPDDTFTARDIFKLLAYSDEIEVVYGSRTVGYFIWQGANMGFFLRFGNYAVAKLMEVLFNTNSLSDVGCTMRLVRREALAVLEPHFTVNGSFFGPEMMCLSVIARLRIVQIPVNYRSRVGDSAVTGDKIAAFRLGLRMIALILDYRRRANQIRRTMGGRERLSVDQGPMR